MVLFFLWLELHPHSKQYERVQYSSELHVQLRKVHKKDIVSVDTTPPLVMGMTLASCSRIVKQGASSLS